MVSRSTSVFCVLETEHQARNAVQSPDFMPENVHYYAVTPVAAAYIKEAGFTYSVPEDYISWKALREQTSWSHKRVVTLCSILEVLFKKLIAEHPGGEHITFSGLHHPLNGIFSALSHRAIPIIRAISQLKPQRIFTAEHGAYSPFGPHLLDKPIFGLASQAAAIVARERGIPLTFYSLSGEDPLLKASCSKGVPSIATHLGTRDYVPMSVALQQAVGQLRKAIQEVVSEQGSRQCLLTVLGDDDIVSPVVNRWSRLTGTEVNSIGELQLKVADMPELWNLLETTSLLAGKILGDLALANQELIDLFNIEEVDFFELAEGVLRWQFFHGVPEMLIQATYAEINMPRFIGSVIFSGGMVYGNSALASVARKYGVPFVTKHRGGFLGYCSLACYDWYDLVNADWFLAGGPAAVKVLEVPNQDAHIPEEYVRAKPFAGGSPWIDAVLERRRKVPGTRACSVKRILYPAAALLGDNTFLDGVFHSEFGLCAFQERLLEEMARFQDVELVCKLPLQRYEMYLPPWVHRVREGEFPNVTILETDDYMEDIQHDFDGLIVDTPSTPLIVAAASNLPVIAWLDERFFTINADALKLLGKRMTVALSEERFFAELPSFFQEELPEGKEYNEAFLYSYVLPERKCEDRIVHFLQSLLGEAVQPRGRGC